MKTLNINEKKEKKSNLMPLFLIILIGAITLLVFGYYHEAVHQAIYQSYGINSEVYYLKYFPDFVTIPVKPCPTDSCTLAQNLTESIGYQLLPLISFITLLALFFYFRMYSQDKRLKEIADKFDNYHKEYLNRINSQISK